MERPTTAERQRLVRVARGLEPADLVIRNAHVVDVFTLEVREGDVAICGAWIAGIGSPKAIVTDEGVTKKRLSPP